MINTKSLAAAQYLLTKCVDASVTPMQLIKLVYIAHGYMLGRHGRPLLDEPVQAWQYGPVVPSVYHAVKDYKSSPLPKVPGALPFQFSDMELAVMDEVATTYGCCSGITLSSATHLPGTPWSKTWKLAGKNSPISNDIIESFYVDLLSRPSHSAL